MTSNSQKKDSKNTPAQNKRLEEDVLVFSGYALNDFSRGVFALGSDSKIYPVQLDTDKIHYSGFISFSPKFGLCRSSCSMGSSISSLVNVLSGEVISELPKGVSVGKITSAPNGNIYASDGRAHQIWNYTTSKVSARTPSAIQDFAFDKNGSLWVSQGSSSFHPGCDEICEVALDEDGVSDFSNFYKGVGDYPIPDWIIKEGFHPQNKNPYSNSTGPKFSSQKRFLREQGSISSVCFSGDELYYSLLSRNSIYNTASLNKLHSDFPIAFGRAQIDSVFSGISEKDLYLFSRGELSCVYKVPSRELNPKKGDYFETNHNRPILSSVKGDSCLLPLMDVCIVPKSYLKDAGVFNKQPVSTSVINSGK